ncbi:hypothetical protein FA95DRAFT_1599781 [Auriscalpium vulgare]|uniref:Uncharacterized protein n=1 Tax=Auriscalpium vulgare TaxID=40419 RepID=A0ACB8R6Q5_9AGAM|nr:hypothetical protein FA95DRAFT_1599781 [Auriscalpium vulgare]
MLIFLVLLFLPAGLASLFSREEASDNRTPHERWFATKEAAFRKMRIAPEKRTAYAIQFGFLDNAIDVDLQGVMISSLNQLTARNITWPWDQFKADISHVATVAQHYKDTKRRPYYGSDAAVVALLEASPVSKRNDLAQVAVSQLDTLIDDIGGLLDTSVDVIRARGLALPHIDFPDWDWVKKKLNQIGADLERAKKALERAIDDVSANLLDVVKAVHDFATAQIALLPQEVRHAIEKVKEFREEHPYLAAAATIVIGIAVSEFIFVPAALGLLRLVGFSEIGPAAGSWAALIQSAFYAGRTRGLFSIVQSITMGAKSYWPAAVLMAITAIGEGVLLWERGALRELVDGWRTEGVRPQIGAMLEHEVDEKFMREVGDRCSDAGVPEVQWLDVAQQFVVREVEESVGDV